jgi:hypothetical protein
VTGLTLALVLVGIPIAVLGICFVLAFAITHLEYRSAPGRGCSLCAGMKLSVMRRLPPCPQCGRTA